LFHCPLEFVFSSINERVISDSVRPMIAKAKAVGTIIFSVSKSPVSSPIKGLRN
jgi:hypothetical protein